MSYSLRSLTLKHWLMIGGAIALIGLISCFYRQLNVAAIHRHAAELNGFVVFAGIVILPLLGFPVTVVHAVAGVRFGIVGGCAVVAVTIFLQLLASYGLVALAPGFFRKRLEPLRKRLPKGAHIPVTQFTMLLPGVPYFAQIYVLPLIGVPLRILLTWSLPINIARSIVGVSFGGVSDHLTPLRLTCFGIYTVCLMFTSAWAFRRLRRKLAEGAADATTVVADSGDVSAPKETRTLAN